jgi:hypothetical protein
MMPNNINNRFWMGLHYDTSLNDGSYLIGMWGNPFNPHPSELNIAGIGNWQYFMGEVTPILAPVPEPATWSMMILGFLGLGFLAYRRNGLSMRLLSTLQIVASQCCGFVCRQLRCRQRCSRLSDGP